MSRHSRTGRIPANRLLRRCRLPLRVVALLAGLLLAIVANALPDDRDQPIRITADTAIRDEKQGFTVYSGNVHMTQGSMDIEADKLTIFHETAQADKIVAEGKPARMQQKPAVDEPMVRAHAEIIEYYKIEERVHFRIDAHIDQDGASVTGDSIDYFIAEQLVKADSDKATEGNRVQVVIPATTIREEETASGTPASD
jgi:lipopolysaccharide export system protein LptA